MTQSETPRLRTLSKLELRKTLRNAFPGHTPRYDETNTPTTTTGTLQIGAAVYSEECTRGQERLLRASMYAVAKDTHEKLMEGLKNG